MTRLVYLATSTTGTNPRHHELIELALIERISGHPERVSHWRMRAFMPDADAAHLRRIGYFDRPAIGHDVVAIDANLGTASPVDPGLLALDLQQRLFDAIVIGLDVARELRFVDAWLERRGALPAWRSAIDLTSAAAGALHGVRHGWYGAAQALRRPIGEPHVDASGLDVAPWNPYQLARGLGVSNVVTDASDAVARARLAVQVWDVLAAPPPPALQPEPEPQAEARPEAAPAEREHPHPGDRQVAPRPRTADQTAVMNLADMGRL